MHQSEIIITLEVARGCGDSMANSSHCIAKALNGLERFVFRA